MSGTRIRRSAFSLSMAAHATSPQSAQGHAQKCPSASVAWLTALPPGRASAFLAGAPGLHACTTPSDQVRYTAWPEHSCSSISRR
eukprot:5245370-Amphidinium_carterae.1